VKRKSIEFRAIYAPILSKFYFIFLLSNTHEQIFIILVEVEIKSGLSILYQQLNFLINLMLMFILPENSFNFIESLLECVNHSCTVLREM
jgi:hypothetical protein